MDTKQQWWETEKITDKQIPDYYAIGPNVYRNEELSAFVPDPDTFYIDADVIPGYYDYCVATVYTADSGLYLDILLNRKCVFTISFAILNVTSH